MSSPMYSHPEELNYMKNYQQLQNKTCNSHIWRSIFFIKKLFQDINANIFCYKLGQSCNSLTCTFPITTCFFGTEGVELKHA
jgi:hypothetical protein